MCQEHNINPQKSSSLQQDEDTQSSFKFKSFIKGVSFLWQPVGIGALTIAATRLGVKPYLLVSLLAQYAKEGRQNE